jgi:sarcosine oxidase, subunit beta
MRPSKSGLGAAVVIVGGGVTGLSTAWWLARAGVDVTVLEKGIVGWEASGRNGGGTTHFHSPLFHEEQRLWPMMDELLGYPTEYRRERLIIALTQQELSFYAAWRIQGQRLGYQVSDLDPKQVLEFVPFANEANLGGIHLHFGGHANPQRTAQAYAWALQDLGGKIFQHATVVGLELSGDRVTGVNTTRGHFGLDSLVIAAGPQTGSLLRQVGVHLPLAVARAEMIITEPAPAIPIGGIDGNGLYGRQTLRGNLAFGGGPHEWVDVDADAPSRPTSPLTRNIALRLAQLLPGAARLRLIRSWAGLIENTPDGRPVLDRLEQPANLVVATMSSVGFGLSPAVGRAVRDLVLDGRCTFANIDKYNLRRFTGLPADWIESRGWLPPEPAPDIGRHHRSIVE